MSIKNHHQLIHLPKIKKAFTLSMFSKTSAVLLMLLFCFNSRTTASSEKISSEGFVSELPFRINTYAETGVPAGVKIREEIKIYNKYRFEEFGILQKVREKVMDHLDFSCNNQISRSCSETI